MICRRGRFRRASATRLMPGVRHARTIMNEDLIRQKLGEPDLQVVGFQLWVHGREFPDSGDYYDGNWLRITAHAGASGAGVWVSGPLLMVPDLALWAGQCEVVARGEAEKAQLQPMETELKVTIEAVDQLGHLTMLVDITPDQFTQKHSFEFDIDQTYLPDIVRQCRSIVASYPIRDANGRHGA
jgi:hypothetical protein